LANGVTEFLEFSPAVFTLNKLDASVTSNDFSLNVANFISYP